MSNSDTPTPTVASDWLVSITPTPHGDWVLPGGMRYNLTLHNGATPGDVTAVLATLAAIENALVSAYDAPSAPASNGSSNPPSTQKRQAPPPPEGAEGEDVYGKGFIVEGGQFDVEIERAVKTATGSGKPKLDLYRPGNQYPSATINEGGFDAFHAATGVHGNDLTGEATFDPPKLLRFKLGKKKRNSEKHYWDFVGAPSGATEQSANGGQKWNMVTVLDELSLTYPNLPRDKAQDGVNKLNPTDEMTTPQVVDAFKAAVVKATATDPKAG